MVRAETIAALATASGKGALAVIRISGQGAFDVFAGCVRERERFRGAEDRRIGLYTVVDPVDERCVDQVTAIRYRAPRSYTGEDMVEVITHGGEVAPSMVLGVILRGGACEARPGEFTYRAVMAGKMGLLEAEAMDALIRSESIGEHRRAMACYGGAQGETVARLRERLEGILVGLEAAIEFDEGAGEGVRDYREELGDVCDELEGVVEEFERSGFGGERPRVVIAGEANAGKSTLFNALVGKERSIVDAVSGTTRDYVAQAVQVGGVWVEFVDTAGLGAGQGRVVDRGIERAWELVDRAELVIWVSSAERGSVSEVEDELLRRAVGRVIGIVSKADLCDGRAKCRQAAKRGVRAVSVSLVDTRSREEALALVREMVGELGKRGEGVSVVLNARQAGVFKRVVREGRMVLGEDSAGEDAAAYGVRRMLETVGELTETAGAEDILGRIFGEFCVGK